ncbi:S1C family serine protease [Caproicibacterium amylolyticum]|uniref:Trypsin-like peptidase domain-containing protein n=1 Tax=Caproicibacterium amylolyticum TaxID=2766537 RepID=A0A7G9WGY9_9FIRM|nr:trypsin-like peptidase domain-containing protein [Caproicibacterium amylolyticum]QNO17951.1 trypsin-like peptidase domain-containing protein [Caproicibacterium amylolyticum]
MEEKDPQQGSPAENPQESGAPKQPAYQPEEWYPDGSRQSGEKVPPQLQQNAQDNLPAGRPPVSYRNPAVPYRRKPLSKGIKVLIGILLALLVILVGMMIGFGIHDARQSEDFGSSESQEPSDSSETTVSRAKDVIPNNGEKTNSIITLQKKAGSTLTPETVFTKVSPSVVGVLANIPAANGKPSESQGTGIVASSDGVILTNSHVIGNTNSTTVTVILSDSKQYDARILGYDKTSDLAVLKISATGLTAAAFGEAEELKVGEQVLAIGNPDGMNYSNSLTGGYVSALNRPIAGHSDNGMTYIQTDAAINPGNSGGPLCNLYGQVVGINSCKIVTTGYEGMGFAIPMSKAVSIINQLIQKGYVQGRTRLGIICRVVPSYEAAMLQISGGVQIISIDQESSLNGSGVQKDDILYEIDGKKITALDDLTGILSKYKPGDEVPAKVYSTKKAKTLQVKIKLLEDKGETQKTVSQP